MAGPVNNAILAKIKNWPAKEERNSLANKFIYDTIIRSYACPLNELLSE